MGNVNMEAKQIHYRNNKKPAVHNVDNALDRLFDSSDSLVSDINDLTESVYNKADKTDIAPTFSAETAYFVGDLVYESGKLWRFTANHAAGEWNQEEVAAVKISDELVALKSGLMNETVLLNQLLTTTSTYYILNGLVDDYMFIAFILGWYGNDNNDNMIVMPSSAFSCNDYLILYRKNDPATNAYAKINQRGYANGVDSIYAEGTEGVSIKVVGIIHK